MWLKVVLFFMVVWFIIVKKICRYGHSIVNVPIDILCMFDVDCPLGLYERCGKGIMYFRIMQIFLRKNAVFLLIVKHFFSCPKMGTIGATE